MSQDGHTALCAIILWVCIIFAGLSSFPAMWLALGAVNYMLWADRRWE